MCYVQFIHAPKMSPFAVLKSFKFCTNSSMEITANLLKNGTRRI